MKKLDPSAIHDRKQFQVDRIAFYSDAIFAIASTLLILEFKIPALGKKHSWSEILELYSDRLYIPVLGLIISFYSISRLWFKHHALYEHVTNYNKRLLIINQVFLFLIMIIPVSTSFVLEEDNPVSLRYCFFFSNLGLCNLAYSLLMYTALHSKNNLSPYGNQEYRMLKKKDRSLESGIALMAAGILALFTVRYFYLPFIPGASIRLFRRFLAFWKFIRSKLAKSGP